MPATRRLCSRSVGLVSVPAPGRALCPLQRSSERPHTWRWSAAFEFAKGCHPLSVVVFFKGSFKGGSQGGGRPEEVSDARAGTCAAIGAVLASSGSCSAAILHASAEWRDAHALCARPALPRMAAHPGLFEPHEPAGLLAAALLPSCTSLLIVGESFDAGSCAVSGCLRAAINYPRGCQQSPKRCGRARSSAEQSAGKITQC